MKILIDKLIEDFDFEEVYDILDMETYKLSLEDLKNRAYGALTEAYDLANKNNKSASYMIGNFLGEVFFEDGIVTHMRLSFDKDAWNILKRF